MAVLSQYLLTLAEVAKSKDAKIGKVAEVLVKHNAVLEDIPYMQMNEGTIHKENLRSALPSVYYRKANQPIPAGKSTLEERTFTAAHFESKSQMDKAVAERGGRDRVAFNRWNQAQGHLQAMAQEHASLLFYGSPDSSAQKVPGFADIFYTITTATNETARNVINAAGSGSDCTSIWLAVWGDQGVFGVYPSGSSAGIKREDMSAGGKLVQIAGTDVNGNAGTFWGYEEDFMVDHGLVVKDWRQVARVANIDTSDLASGSSAADLIDVMISAMYVIENLDMGKAVFYCNRTIEAHLDKQTLTKVGAGGGLTYENVQGKRQMSFRGIPVRRCDSILSSETALT